MSLSIPTPRPKESMDKIITRLTSTIPSFMNDTEEYYLIKELKNCCECVKSYMVLGGEGGGSDVDLSDVYEQIDTIKESISKTNSKVIALEKQIKTNTDRISSIDSSIAHVTVTLEALNEKVLKIPPLVRQTRRL